MTIEPDPKKVVIKKQRKVNYLNNKDMLKEIHKSKCAFSEFDSEEFSFYDVIVSDINDIFLEETREKGRITRAGRESALAYEEAVRDNTTGTILKAAAYKIKPDTIDDSVLVYRVLTHEHIPLAPGRKKNPKTTGDKHIKLNFAPFKHYIIQDGVPVEVGRSHFKNGKFDLHGGAITSKLAKMFILLVEKYSQRSNWRGYTYLEEMKGQALLQLSQTGLQFDESKSDNPFSYFTRLLQNSFIQVLNLEKRNQNMRDDLLIEQGASPSYSRQLALEEEIRLSREGSQDNKLTKK